MGDGIYLCTGIYFFKSAVILDNRRNEPNLKLINIEQVEIEKIDWLLYPFIPFGKVTIVQGDPGEGKTTRHLNEADYILFD